METDVLTGFIVFIVLGLIFVAGMATQQTISDSNEFLERNTKLNESKECKCGVYIEDISKIEKNTIYECKLKGE